MAGSQLSSLQRADDFEEGGPSHSLCMSVRTALILHSASCRDARMSSGASVGRRRESKDASGGPLRARALAESPEPRVHLFSAHARFLY